MNFKKLLFTLTATLLFLCSATAQDVSYKEMMKDPSFNFYDVCAAADAYFETHDKGKGSGYKSYQRWKAENESKYFPSGIRDMVSPYFAAEQYNHFIRKNPKVARSNSPKWVDLGPYDANNITKGYNPGIGRVETFWVNPTNTQHIYMGSRSGGFWKSTNGGATWKNTTDTLVATGVNTLDVSPFNPDSVLINVRNGGNGYSHGIYVSDDGGETWTPTNFNPTNLGWIGLGNAGRVLKIAFHPTIPNLVFVGTTNGLYRSEDGMQTWAKLLSNTDVSDIEFHPANPAVIYLYDDYYWSTWSNKILISSDTGMTFTASATIAGNNDASGFIATTPDAPDNVYFASKNGVWKSTDMGQTFSLLSTPTESCDGFAVSDADSNAMIYGYLNIQASTNGGLTFNTVTAWANTNPGSDYVHADLRTAECINGVFYIGTDGYLCKSSDNGLTWQRLNDGTAIREFYAAGVSQSEYRIFMAGSQDNGTSALTHNGWVEWNGGDGMEALVHPLNPDWMIGSWQFGTRSITKDGAQTRQGANTPSSGSGNAAWQAPLLIDPANHMTIYHFSDKVYITEDFTDYWYEYGDPGMGIINVAALAENTPDVMAVSKNSQMRISTDQWFTSYMASTGLPNYYITDIAFNPRNDSVLVVTNNRYENNGKKVFLSTDLGLTWSNITYNLGDMPVRTVVIDHSDDANIYVGTEIGVYVKPMNGTTWELYGEGLPNSTVKDLEIHYGSNTLKAATWGRGLWEVKLKDRAHYPSLISVSITNPPTDIHPRAGYDQYVTAVVSYSGNVSKVFVRWSNDSRELDNEIEMTVTSDSTYKSVNPIKNFGRGTEMYFKVFAVGQNNDTTESYTYHYTVRSGLIVNGIEEAEEKEFVLYPNPNTGQFIVSVPQSWETTQVKVYDLSGKEVFSRELSAKSTDVVLDVTSGTYVVKIVDGEKELTKQIVIEK